MKMVQLLNKTYTIEQPVLLCISVMLPYNDLKKHPADQHQNECLSQQINVTD